MEDVRPILASQLNRKGVSMGRITYDKLLSLMNEQGLTTYRIRKEKIISEGTLQNIRKEKSITLDSVAALCKVLNCQPGDILEYVEDENEE